MWGRRRYKGGIDGSWKLGVLHLKDIEKIILDVWGSERVDLPDRKAEIELFTLLVLCLNSSEDHESDAHHLGGPIGATKPTRRLSARSALDVMTGAMAEVDLGLSGGSFYDGQRFLPVLSALHVSVACRERALTVVRDTELSSRLRYAGAMLELIACSILYSVQRLIKTANPNSWPGYENLPAVFQFLLEPTIEYAARHECMIYLAYPLVMKDMADYFWPAPNRPAHLPDGMWAAMAARGQDAASLAVQVTVNVAALPALPFIPTKTETNLQKELIRAMHQGERTPLGFLGGSTRMELICTHEASQLPATGRWPHCV